MTHLKPFTITFPQAGRTAHALRAPNGITAEQALNLLGLTDYSGCIVLHGGAAGMSLAKQDAVRALLRDALVPFAEEYQMLVAFGGTRAGAMAALGDAYRTSGATFPLVGLCPINVVSYPGHPAERHTPIRPIFANRLGTPARYPLDPAYTHFILLEDGDFGVESRMMVEILGAFGKPGISLVINGGQITRDEVTRQLHRGRAVIVIAGSGRAADDLLDAGTNLRRRQPTDAAIITVQIDDPAALRQTLAAHFVTTQAR